MIVGTAAIDVEALAKRIGNYPALLSYIDGLVPEEFRHVEKIIFNQRYLCSMKIRGCLAITWDIKKEVASMLESNIEVTGYVDSLIEIRAVLDSCDLEKLQKYMEVL